MNVTISNKIVNNITFDIITIKNDVNFEVKLINYGAKILSIKYLDSKGKNYSVLNCPKDLSHVLSFTNNYGSTIGPVAGRIMNGFVNTCILSTQGYTLSVFMMASFITCLPGIILQLIVIPVLVRILNRNIYKQPEKVLA